MNESVLRRTPLFESHRALKARIVPFAGYEMPVQYSGVLDECIATRKAAGLFDVSHMGQFRLRGKSAIAELNHLVTNDVTRLADGQAQYSLLCNAQGGIIDDLVVYRISAEEIFICVNASNRERDFAWMREHFRTVEFTDESDATALIAIQGPKAEAILSKLEGAASIGALKYYCGASSRLMGIDSFVSRTGYTGEDGFEIYVPSGAAEPLWDRLLAVGKPEGLVPVGLGARDTLRVEMGYPLHGHEISETIDGLSAGLSWVIKLNKPDGFVGCEALKKIAANGPTRKLVAITVKDRRIPRAGYKIETASGQEMGEVTSGTFSPHLNHPIALALVDAEHALNSKFLFKVREAQVEGEKAKLPFVPSRTKSEKKPKPKGSATFQA